MFSASVVAKSIKRSSSSLLPAAPAIAVVPRCRLGVGSIPLSARFIPSSINSLNASMFSAAPTAAGMAFSKAFLESNFFSASFLARIRICCSASFLSAVVSNFS